MKFLSAFLICLATGNFAFGQHVPVAELSSIAPSQSFVTSDDVQVGITIALALGLPSYTMPNTTIYCTKSILIRGGSRNFTLIGQPNTKLVRFMSQDVPLLLVGDNDQYALNNTSLDARFETRSILPAQEGQTSLDLTTYQLCRPGWYIIVGKDPVNDTVTHANGQTTYYYKRELIKVTAQSGNHLTIGQALGRDYADPQLYYLEPDTNPTPDYVCYNIRLQNFTIDGRTAETTLRKSSGARSPRVSKALVLGTCSNCSIDNVTVHGFVTSGINVKMSRETTITNCTVYDGDLVSTGYGIEITGSRFTTISNCDFDLLRLGIMFQSGSMDGHVDHSYIAPGGGWFDVGHGTGERRITYQYSKADRFALANGQWRRGVDGPELWNCTAYQQIDVYGGAENALVSGLYPGEALTAPRIYLFTDGGGVGNPPGPSWCKHGTLQFCRFSNTQSSGQSVFLASGTGQQYRVGDWYFNRCSFFNPLPTGGCALSLIGCANSDGGIFFDNCSIGNSNGYQPPLRFGDCYGTGAWNIQAESCAITNPVAGGQYYTHAVYLMPGSGGTFTFSNDGFNGPSMTPAHVVNDGSGQVIFP